MGALYDLSIAGRRLLRVARGGGASPEPDRARFRSTLEDVLARAPAGVVAQYAFVELPADRPPWTDSGLELHEGEAVTLVSAGRFWFSKRLDVFTGPGFQVWGRVGGMRPLLRGTRDEHTFVAPRDGVLELTSHPPGEWGDEDGEHVIDREDYAAGVGGFLVLVVRWAGEAREGLAALAALGDGAAPFARALAHANTPDSTPEGWRYLWFLGPAEIYARADAEERDAIVCRTHGDVGILQRDFPLALGPDTRLRWSWKVDALPSSLPEDSALSHDYLSIAVEFENGRDLTYTWSCSLPAEFGYACPLPHWTERETHVVVRSGKRGLGEWIAEERALLADYERYVGPAPGRIVRVWLIANSAFQRGRGECRYADMAFIDDDGEHPIE